MEETEIKRNKIEYTDFSEIPGTYAILIGARLQDQPFEEMEFIELKRGTASELVPYGLALTGSLKEGKDSVFNYPNIFNSGLSTPDKTATMFITGDKHRVDYYVEGVKVKRKKYIKKLFHITDTGEVYPTYLKGEMKPLPDCGLRFRLIRID